MLPLTKLVAQKVSNLLTQNNALAQTISASMQAANVAVPLIPSGQVVLSAVAPGLGDRNVQLTYPRVCVYASALKNSQTEKFRSLSGAVTVVVEIWASDVFVEDVDQSIHFYIDAMTTILQQNLGDWNDGVFYPGLYDVQLQAPVVGGLGFVESAKLSINLLVSRN